MTSATHFPRSVAIAAVVAVFTALSACGPSVPVGVWEYAGGSGGINLTCPLDRFEIRRDSLVMLGVAHDVNYRSRSGRTEAIHKQMGATLITFENRGGELDVELGRASEMASLLGNARPGSCRYRRVRR